MRAIMSPFKSPNRFSLLSHSLSSPQIPFKSPNRFSLLSHSLSSPQIPPRLRFLGVSPRRFSAITAGPSPNTFMEVVKEALRRASANDGGVAIRSENKSYGYAQLVASASDISNYLHSIGSEKIHERCKTENLPLESKGRTGHLHGARIGIVAKPSSEFVAGVLGIWLSGGVAVPLALSYPEVELLHVMNDSDVSVLLSTQDHQELMENVAAKSSAHFSIIPAVTSSSSNANLHDHTENGVADMISKLIVEIQDSREADGDDPALILYTSGTTGKPKGVVHTHKSIMSQVQILTEAWEYTCADQFLHCLPLHHVHGFFNALLAPLYAGSVVEFMPKFSVRGVWQRWRESYPIDGSKAVDAITLFTGVPTMYTWLLQGYGTMDPDLQVASASAAQNLRLMVTRIKDSRLL